MHKTNAEHMNIYMYIILILIYIYIYININICIYIYMDTKSLMTTIAYWGRLPEGIPIFIFSIHKRHRFQGMAGMGTGPILWCQS
jgi:hypothetical protein